MNPSTKTFGGPAFLLDRSDINTDEIIPAKYLTEITKLALKPHLLEDLLLDGQPFQPSIPGHATGKGGDHPRQFRLRLITGTRGLGL